MKNVILVGMPGSGKTTVKNIYKKIYGKNVFDTDELIEREYGDVSGIFLRYGEEYFRDAETEAVKKVCKERGAFIATGGGIVLREENVRLLKESGRIVYLRTSPSTLYGRLEGDTSRPLLKDGDGLRRLYEERTPIYERIADIIVDTDGLDPDAVLEKIMLGVEE